MFHIECDGARKRFYVRILFFIAKLVQKVDLQVSPVDLAREIEQVHLDRKSVV